MSTPQWQSADQKEHFQRRPRCPTIVANCQATTEAASPYVSILHHVVHQFVGTAAPAFQRPPCLVLADDPIQLGNVCRQWDVLSATTGSVNCNYRDTESWDHCAGFLLPSPPKNGGVVQGAALLRFSLPRTLPAVGPIAGQGAAVLAEAHLPAALQLSLFQQNCF